MRPPDAERGPDRGPVLSSTLDQKDHQEGTATRRLHGDHVTDLDGWDALADWLRWVG